jgi:hypothetical protein
MPPRYVRQRLTLLSFFVTNWPLTKAVYQAWYHAGYIASQCVALSTGGGVTTRRAQEPGLLFVPVGP